MNMKTPPSLALALALALGGLLCLAGGAAAQTAERAQPAPTPEHVTTLPTATPQPVATPPEASRSPAIPDPPGTAGDGNHATATVVVQTGERDGGPRLEYERPENFDDPPPERRGPRILHGFRLGYMYWGNYEKEPPQEGDTTLQSPADELDLRSPHMFVIGYEVAHRLRRRAEDLNVMVVVNLMAAGLEQSKILPSGNALIAFELFQSLQLGVGANVSPALNDKIAHMVLALGWTPRSRDLYLPVHLFFIPDVDGYHRAGITFGITWDRGLR